MDKQAELKEKDRNKLKEYWSNLLGKEMGKDMTKDVKQSDKKEK